MGVRRKNRWRVWHLAKVRGGGARSVRGDGQCGCGAARGLKTPIQRLTKVLEGYEQLLARVLCGGEFGFRCFRPRGRRKARLGRRRRAASGMTRPRGFRLPAPKNFFLYGKATGAWTFFSVPGTQKRHLGHVEYFGHTQFEW